MEVQFTMEKFIKVIKRVAGSRLGDLSAVEEATLVKNNELVHQGTEVLVHGNRIHRSVYLDYFYKVFAHEGDLRRCLGKMIRVDVKLEEIADGESMLGDLSDWEKIRSKVYCRIINRVRNLKLLQESPHKDYLDLAVIYQLEIRDRRSYIYSIRITEKLLEKMGISVDVLHEQAVANMKKKFPCKTELLEDVLLNQTAFDREHIQNGDQLNLPVYMMQNRLEADGATVLLDKEPFEQLADQLKANLIIFPTSIHEVMSVSEALVPVPIPDMKTLLMQVNTGGYIRGDEQLSPHIYRYDRKKEALEIAA